MRHPRQLGAASHRGTRKLLKLRGQSLAGEHVTGLAPAVG